MSTQEQNTPTPGYDIAIKLLRFMREYARGHSTDHVPALEMLKRFPELATVEGSNLTVNDITEVDHQAIIDWCNERYPIDPPNYVDNNEPHLAAMLSANHFVLRSYKVNPPILTVNWDKLEEAVEQMERGDYGKATNLIFEVSTTLETIQKLQAGKPDELSKAKERIEELEFALKLQGKSGQEIKWFSYDMFRMELVKFALAYHKSTNKDISNDSAEWAHEIFTKSSHE